MEREVIKDFYGRTLGTIITDKNGNKVIRDFYGKILGKYDKKANLTRDFHGKIIARGDRSAALIPTSSDKLNKR